MPQIERLQIYGVRCSGTNWVDSLMRENYQEVKIMPTDFTGGNDNFGWKHANLGREIRTYVDGQVIQHAGERIIWKSKGVDVSQGDRRYAGVDEDGDWYVKNNALPLDRDNSDNTLLVVVNRNPLSWLQSLHRKPHHAMDLYDASFTDFVRKPWKTYASATLGSVKDPESRERWKRKGVIIEDEPSVFAHRQASLETFQSFADRVEHVVYVPYETVLRDPEKAISDIASVYGISTEPAFKPVTAYKRRGNETFDGNTYEPVTAADLAYVVSQIDKDTEAGAGYLFPDSDHYSQQDLLTPARIVGIRPDLRFFRHGEQIFPNAA